MYNDLRWGAPADGSSLHQVSSWDLGSLVGFRYLSMGDHCCIMCCVLLETCLWRTSYLAEQCKAMPLLEHIQLA